jgi:hypothetical protein
MGTITTYRNHSGTCIIVNDEVECEGKRRAKFIYIPFSNIFGLANFFMSKVNEYYDLYFLKLVCFFNSQCINFCLLVMYI